MNDDRESERIMMNVRQAGRMLNTMFWIGSPAAMFLLTFLKRMVKQKLLKVGEYEKLEKFVAATNGEYTIANIPIKEMVGAKEKAEIRKELDELGVTFSVLPDFNKEDGLVQFAIADKDQAKFSAWYSRHVMQDMQGGEHEIQDLKNLTEGQMNIVSIPFEGKEEIVNGDFDKLGINYAILPDLNVGDGELQCYVANADIPKVEHWYGLYKEAQIEKGEAVADLKIVSEDSYAESGNISSEQYVNMSDDAVKTANALYEGQQPGTLEQAVMKNENKMQHTENAAYDKLNKNVAYEKITINHESLVVKSNIASKLQENANFFCSRIPGTWGNEERTLVLPREQVFLTDDGQTYIGFLEKEKKAMLLDATGAALPMDERLSGAEIKKKYNDVNRGFKTKNSIQKTADKNIEKVTQTLSARNQTNISRGQGKKGEYFKEMENALILNATASPPNPIKVK